MMSVILFKALKITPKQYQKQLSKQSTRYLGGKGCIIKQHINHQ